MKGQRYEGDSKKGGKLELTPSDRALIYLELIDCFQAQGKTVCHEFDIS